MPSVTIGSNNYDVYADVETADVYLAAQVSASTWNDVGTTSDQKAAALVSMTRILDRQQWAGAQTDGYETHAWPRSGCFYPDGTAVDSGLVPQAVIDACCEGAAQLVAGGTFQDTPDTFDFNRVVKAGSVMVERFRQTEPSSRFPQVIMELIGPWLGGGVGIVGSKSTGTDGRTIMNEDYDVSRGF